MGFRAPIGLWFFRRARSGDAARTAVGSDAAKELTGLAAIIQAVERRTEEICRRHGPVQKVFSFGASDLDPRHLAVWIVTPNDRDRDRLRADRALEAELRAALHDLGYPAAAIPAVGFAFESQQTVDRDYGGNWWHAVR
jgi:hypothetical protein